MHALLLTLAIGFGEDPTITLPQEVKGKAGRVVYIEATTKGKLTRFFAFTTEADLIRVGPHKVGFVSPFQGRFTVIGFTAFGDEPSEAAVCVVVIGDPGPPPDPGPIPPKPIPPIPVPDAFKAALQAAWNLEQDPNKGEYRLLLSQLYRQSGTKLPAVNTAGEMLKFMSAARKILMPDAALLPVRQVIEKELNLVLPTNPSAAIDRTVVGTQFLTIASALEGLK